MSGTTRMGMLRAVAAVTVACIVLHASAARAQAPISDEQVARIARGLTEFIIARAQRDVIDSVFDNILVIACGTANASPLAPGRKFLGHTCALRDGDLAIHQPVSFSAEYRAALARDVAAVPEVLATAISPSPPTEAVVDEASMRWRVLQMPAVLAGIDRTRCELDPWGCVDVITGRLGLPHIPTSDALLPASLRTAVVRFGQADPVHLAAAAGDVAAALLSVESRGTWATAARRWIIEAGGGSARGIVDGALAVVRATGAAQAIPPTALRLIALAEALADAESDAEVQSILESLAAPAGSARARSERPTAAIAGWLGVGGGAAILTTGTPGSMDTSSVTVAPTLQIGVDLTGPLCTRGTAPRCSGWPFGVFIAILDLGNLVRWSGISNGFVFDESASVKPGIGSFLAPGLYLRLSPSSIPLVVAAGASFVPDFRRRQDASGVQVSDPAVVIQLLVGINVDLFAF